MALPSEPAPQLGLQELCARLGVSYRDARYVCEKGWLPSGVDPEPGRGNHRRLTPAQAVWLGIVLKLKACGVRTGKAARIAAFADGVKGPARTLGWDWPFSPFDGAFQTEHRWLIEVGDMRFVRFLTDANPSREGLDPLPWVELDSRRPAPQAAPIVSLQIDLSALARLLQGLSG
jgi:hypothetical protein